MAVHWASCSGRRLSCGAAHCQLATRDSHEENLPRNPALPSEAACQLRASFMLPRTPLVSSVPCFSHELSSEIYERAPCFLCTRAARHATSFTWHDSLPRHSQKLRAPEPRTLFPGLRESIPKAGRAPLASAPWGLHELLRSWEWDLVKA